MKTTLSVFLSAIFLCVIVSQGLTFEYHWEIDETPEGQESATVVEPVQVTILDEQIEIASHSASLWLMRRYSVHLGTEWSGAHAYKLLQTFESIPQERNSFRDKNPRVPISLWKLSNRHIQDDIEIEFQGDTKVVTVAEEAFTYANPLLAEIEGVRGRYFSKRLHRAVVRFVTDNATHRYGFIRILRDRYDVSIDVPDYTELTRHTTGEHAGRFSEFKNEELMAIVSMLEEFPQGMLKTPGLKYLVRRLDGTPHPFYPEAAAVAWTGAGYIEFMEAAFKGQGVDSIHRVILHEKAHFLWEHLFDEQLKQDWIELGGWYENPDDKDGWSTTKQTEFVSAYAHGVNPNEDMAESISHYIVRPDKLRSRSPAKYEFIQNRVMHGTRYISKIREDLTFEVYNLYPDYVYPGKIIRVDIQVNGKPEEDKQITIEIEIHGESNLDSAHGAYMRLFSERIECPFEDVGLSPINPQGQRISAGHIFRGHLTLSRYAVKGYWTPDQIRLRDANGNERYQSQTDIGWKLYIDNPLEHCKAPIYVKNSVRLSLSQELTERGHPYQIVHVRWRVIERFGVTGCTAVMNDKNRKTYSIGGGNGYGVDEGKTIAQKGGEVQANIVVPDYRQSGTYSLAYIETGNISGNIGGAWFIPPEEQSLIRENDQFVLDEGPYTIEIQTRFPDDTPPELDLNEITIKAEPTRPTDPNGETSVDISFRVKDDISGYSGSKILLRDPQGVMHGFNHGAPDHNYMYFIGDPTVYKDYQLSITLPVGSVPGTWGLAEMTVFDKAGNTQRANFTEIVRFRVDDGTVFSKFDVNEDGQINILDLVIVAAFDASNERADVNGDGTVNILDLVTVASQLGEEGIAAPAINNPTADQIQNWITQAMQADDGSPAFRRGIRTLQSLLLKLRPETTALLPNYPNPFNPETWIPYHLATASDVQITIYDTRGSVVRTLVLGHRVAGYYTDKERAAYWDGRNNVGERIASGVYFYQLQADSISQLRKMVILK
ncbi:MAG: dockerin type I domain-containing protein [Candidatus Poribacteria bacterium]|nr:dockerin type I domain-containing protein [Candidatus Poribacteria bacterium]